MPTMYPRGQHKLLDKATRLTCINFLRSHRRDEGLPRHSQMFNDNVSFLNSMLRSLAEMLCYLETPRTKSNTGAILVAPNRTESDRCKHYSEFGNGDGLMISVK